MKNEEVNALIIIHLPLLLAAYLKAAEGLEGEAEGGGVRGAELWALAIGATAAVLLLLVLLALLCVAHRYVGYAVFGL